MSHSLQKIHNSKGIPEYVLLPITIYEAMEKEIQNALRRQKKESDYDKFLPEDFIKNPIALMRMKAKIKQTSLAKKLNVSQAYISKIENDDYKVTDDLLKKIKNAIQVMLKK